MENKGIIKIENQYQNKKTAVLNRMSVHMIRFVLGFVIGRAKIFGDLSPFGVGFVASCGDKSLSVSALAGVLLSYIVSSGFISGIKYISAAVLVFAAGHMLKKWPPSKSTWFSPAVAFFVMSVFSIACDLMPNPTTDKVVMCVCDALAAGACAYFLSSALSKWTGKLDFTRSDEIGHTVSIMALLAVLLIALDSIKALGGISLGRIAALLIVILFAYKGGAGSGCAAGASLGMAMDASAGMFWFTALYSLVGMLAGVFSKHGKLYFIITAIMTCGVVSALQMENPMVPACLYEMFIVSVLFMLLPNNFLNRIEAFLPSSVSGHGERKTREHIQQRLQQASDAFSALYATVRDAVGLDRNDSDIAAVFDAAAEKVCRYCGNSQKCWISEYETTLDALNGVSAKMLAEGELLKIDLPEYFLDACTEQDDFVAAVNEELKGLSYRRQYRVKLMNNQKAAFGQYADVASILSGFANELRSEMRYEPGLEARIGKYLKAQGISGDVAVYKGSGGRIRAEISSYAAAKLKKNKNWLEELSDVMGMRLCTGESEAGYSVVMAAEPLSAAVGIAAVNKGSSRYSGDNSSYFKTDEGVLYVVLSDGMGSGKEAEKYSRNAVAILESFLKSGVAAETAVRILNDLMLLKNQNETECCTVDIISIDLFSGKTAVFKYGAAASYLKYDEDVERISGTSLAAGLGFPPEDVPDIFKVDLHPGSFAIMVSDGVTSGGCDNWLFELLEKYDGEDPKELAGTIVKNAVKLYGDQDDMTAFVIYVSERK